VLLPPPEEFLARLKATLAYRPEVLEAYLFGSRARGDAGGPGAFALLRLRAAAFADRRRPLRANLPGGLRAVTPGRLDHRLLNERLEDFSEFARLVTAYLASQPPR
jgi:hypothetical protein